MLRRSAPLLALAVVLVLALSSCSSGAKPSATPTSAPATPIAQLNTGSMRLARIDFCSLLPKTAIAAAVGTKQFRSTSYGNGDSAQITPDVNDVAHELSCTYTDGETTARAWVFGLAVSPALARSVKRQARHQSGCQLVSAPDFGTPTLKQECTSDGQIRVRYAGLFGDTWLTCEVSGPLPRPTAEDRAGSWCVAVATALNQTS